MQDSITSGDCFIGDQKVPCPKSSSENTQSEVKLDILPNIQSLNKRNNTIFSSILIIVIIILISLAIFKIKIFGKTLLEYLVPIWYFILATTMIIIWQYLVGVNLNSSSIQLQISQWFWQGIVLLSAFKLSRQPNINYANMFFLGVIYSLFIHGLKVSIRYYFYHTTLLYSLDRFVYGTLLTMTFAFLLGSVFVYTKTHK